MPCSAAARNMRESSRRLFIYAADCRRRKSCRLDVAARHRWLYFMARRERLVVARRRMLRRLCERIFKLIVAADAAGDMPSNAASRNIRVPGASAMPANRRQCPHHEESGDKSLSPVGVWHEAAAGAHISRCRNDGVVDARDSDALSCLHREMAINVCAADFHASATLPSRPRSTPAALIASGA